MNNFTLFTPTKIRFGKGQIAKLSSEIPKEAKVLMLYGGGSIKRNGVYEQVLAALDGYDVHEFSGIEPNPAYETLVKAIAYIREHDISYLLAVGGGSVIDGTKFIAAAVDYPGDPWDIITTGGRNIRSALPIACVLTLPATGSETNCFLWSAAVKPGINSHSGTRWCIRSAPFLIRRPLTLCRRVRQPTAWLMPLFTPSSSI